MAGRAGRSGKGKRRLALRREADVDIAGQTDEAKEAFKFLCQLRDNQDEHGKALIVGTEYEEGTDGKRKIIREGNVAEMRLRRDAANDVLDRVVGKPQQQLNLGSNDFDILDKLDGQCQSFVAISERIALIPVGSLARAANGDSDPEGLRAQLALPARTADGR